MCLPLLIFPCPIKSRNSLLASADPGDSGKRAIKRLCVCVVCNCLYLVPLPRYYQLFPKNYTGDHLTQTHPLRELCIMHALAVINISLHTKFELSSFNSFTHSKDMIKAGNFKNGSHETDHAHFRVNCHPIRTLDMAYPCTKFDNSSFSHSRGDWGPTLK